MKIKLREIIEAQPALGQILGTAIPFKLSYRIERMASKIMSEMKVYDKTREKILEKYAKKDDKGKIITKRDARGITSVELENEEAFHKELEPIQDTEIDLGVEQIPYKLLEEANINLSAYDVAMVKMLIADPLPEVKEKK